MGAEQTWFRFVRRLAARSSSELSLVYVPDGTADRLAVLKRLPAALATDPTAVEKFRVEARIAARLEHPSIVRVLELVETPNDDFYTMEYVRGADLRQLMDVLAKERRTLPLDCVLLIAIELCAALDYAHHLCDAAGVPSPVVHRELSPSKVLIGSDGTIKLTGFGAPPLVATRPRRSRTESIGYTSPERCLGETLDARSDLFALGVLLYELSSGTQLYADTKNENQILGRILRGQMPRPSELRRGYPRELETILMRALAREPSQRYQKAVELQTDLESFLWSRWPTASTTALAKLVSTAFPDTDTVATGSVELERIDPFNQNVAPPPAEEHVLWLGPVPLAKPYPLAEQPRPNTRDLKRMAPEKLGEGSNVDVALGAPGPRDAVRRAAVIDKRKLPRAVTTVDERAKTVPTRDPLDFDVVIEEPTPRATTAVQLGTPGPKPSPLDGTSARAAAFDARHQYQRPEALDEHEPPTEFDNRVIEKLRAKQRAVNANATPGTIARLQLARSFTPAVIVQEVVRPPKTGESPKLEAPKPESPKLEHEPPPRPSPVLRLPSPAPVVARRWPIATIASIALVVVFGVGMSAWAVLRNTHAPSQLPDTKAQPAPPDELIVHAAKTPEAAPKKLKAGELDAQPSIKTIELKGTIAVAPIRKAVEEALTPLRACYRTAAKAKQTNPATSLTIAFDVDHRREPLKVSVRGGGDLDALAPCAAKVASAIGALPAPSGIAHVTITLDFVPTP